MKHKEKKLKKMQTKKIIDKMKKQNRRSKRIRWIRIYPKQYIKYLEN